MNETLKIYIILRGPVQKINGKDMNLKHLFNMQLSHLPKNCSLRVLNVLNQFLKDILQLCGYVVYVVVSKSSPVHLFKAQV